jgi:ubiquinone/menaquinone biosynthesis C-methylase UbiE
MPTIGNLIYRTYSSKEKIERLQQKIRDREWCAVVPHVIQGGHFLDVGCGAGYSMFKAKMEKGCQVAGVDPDPGGHGVGRFLEKFPQNEIIIKKAFAENLPFDDGSFNTVYSSHVLEHVIDEEKALREMARVLKSEGVAIIGMPTATMAWINWISQLVFTTHIKIYEFFRFFLLKGKRKRFVNIFKIHSHSFPRADSIWYDFSHYRISNWEKKVKKSFEILEKITPCLYTYPDFPQVFPLHKNPFGSSSVFFICKKKKIYS